MIGLTVRKNTSMTLRDEKKRVEVACHNKQSILRLFNEKNRPVFSVHVYGKDHEKVWKAVQIELFTQFCSLSENGSEYQFSSFRKQNAVVKEMIGLVLSVFAGKLDKKLIQFSIPIPEEPKEEVTKEVTEEK